MIEISEEVIWLIIPVCIILLIILLLIRLKYQVRRTVKNEIYANFPSLKNKIEEYERRIDYFKIEIDDLERRMRQLENKS